MTTPYELRVSAPARRARSGTLPTKVAAAVLEFLPMLALDPRRVEKRLNPPFSGTWSARRGDYRTLYEIDEQARLVQVTAVRHRSDAYRG